MRNSCFKFVLGLLAVVLLPFAGCGGSTRGSGGVTVEGRVSNTANQPQSDVQVTVLQTGDSTSTDQQGNYSLVTEAQQTLDLLFERGNFAAQVSIQDIPENTARVRAEVEIDEQQNKARPTKVETEQKQSSVDDDDNSGSANDDNDDDDSDDNPGSGNDDDDDDDSDDNPGSGNDDDDDDDNDNNPGSGNDDDDDDDNDDSSSSSNEDDDEGAGEESCEDRDAEGVIESLGANSITVSGVTFAVTSETEIRDEEGDDISLQELNSADTVRVQGDCENGLLVADDIRVENS